MTRLRRAAKSLLSASGHYRRRLADDDFPGVVVLCYHGVQIREQSDTCFTTLHVTARELDDQLRFLKETCHPIDLSQWLEDRVGGVLPRRPVLVTFDDGYRSVLTLGLPLLEKYEIPALVFVASGPVTERRPFWHDAVALTDGEDAVESWKAVPYADWRTHYETIAPPRSVDENSAYAPMTPDDVATLARHPLFEVGGHTTRHAILSRATVDQQREEILSNRETLQGWTGAPVRAFAYPNGRPGRDYTATSVDIVWRAGYRAAFTTSQAFSDPKSPTLETPRFLVLSGTDASELAHRLSYSWRRGLTPTKVGGDYRG